MRERARRLGGKPSGKQGGRSIISKAWLVCRGLLFMKRVAIAQRNLHRSIRHNRWDSEGTLSMRCTSVEIPSGKVEENAQFEKLTRAEVLKLWQDLNDMTIAAEIKQTNHTSVQDTDVACTPDRASSLRTNPREATPWKKVFSRFQYNKQRPKAAKPEPRIMQVTFRERLRTWLRIQDPRTSADDLRRTCKKFEECATNPRKLCTRDVIICKTKIEKFEKSSGVSSSLVLTDVEFRRTSTVCRSSEHCAKWMARRELDCEQTVTVIVIPNIGQESWTSRVHRFDLFEREGA